MPQTLQTILLDAIQSTLQNPRSDLEEDDALRGLAASLGDEENTGMVSPPLVEHLGDGNYRILAGERRIQAARLAGWQKMDCIVRPELPPEEAHRIRLVENLHRQDLHPLDRAAALKIAWFFANAKEMGIEQEARKILGQEQTPQTTLEELSTLLSEHDFAPTHPAVVWDDVLNRLGIDLTPARRKKLLQILAIAPEVQERAREANITEAALRSLGQLEPDGQGRVMEEIEDDPSMARNVRRISHAVRAHGYELEDAISEAKGELVIDDEIAGMDSHQYAPDEGDDILNDKTMDVVLTLLDVANQVTASTDALKNLLNGRVTMELSSPWGEYAAEAIKLIHNATHRLH